MLCSLVFKETFTMNVHAPFPSPGLPPAIWQEHRTPDNRTYYYNVATKATQWTKPEDMMTPAEVSTLH